MPKRKLPRRYEVLQLATKENLDEEAYLQANPDVARAELSAHEHFEKYGHAENRLQFDTKFLASQPAYRQAKFKRFRSCLYPELAPHRTFPIVLGDTHFDLDQYMAESANPGFGPFNEEIEKNPGGLYLDLGCGFRQTVYENCLYLEVYPSFTADLIVEPTCLYPIRTHSLDGVGCFAVLEHTRQPWLVTQEIKRMLKPGGKAFIDWPFLQPVHGFPSHFFNATREGLLSLFKEEFDIEHCFTGPHQTPAHTIQWILYELMRQIPEGADKQSLMKLSLEELAMLPPRSELWLQIMSQLPDMAISELACGNCLIAVSR